MSQRGDGDDLDGRDERLVLDRLETQVQTSVGDGRLEGAVVGRVTTHGREDVDVLRGEASFCGDVEHPPARRRVVVLRHEQPHLVHPIRHGDRVTGRAVDVRLVQDVLVGTRHGSSGQTIGSPGGTCESRPSAPFHTRTVGDARPSSVYPGGEGRRFRRGGCRGGDTHGSQRQYGGHYTTKEIHFNHSLVDCELRHSCHP